MKTSIFKSIEETVLFCMLILSVVVLFSSNANCAWKQSNGPSGGIINTVEVDPSNASTVYAAGEGASVFKSTDGGKSWQALSSLITSSEFFTGIIVAKDGKSIFAMGSGILFRSNDSGTSWTAISDAVGDSDLFFNSFAVSPDDDQLVLTGTVNGQVFKSTDGGSTWTDISGSLPSSVIWSMVISTANDFWVGTGFIGGAGDIYHSNNGGSSWQKQDTGQRSNAYVCSLFADPDDSNTIYAGYSDTADPSPESPDFSNLIITTDNGASWSKNTYPFTGVNILGKSSNNTLYASAGGSLYQSTDKGVNWTQITLPMRAGDFYDIGLHPTDPKTVYVPLKGYGIVKSTDEGANWTYVNNGLKNVGVALLAAPNTDSNSDIYASSAAGQGLFKSSDSGNNWTNITSNGITHPWGDEIQISPSDPESVWFIADVGEIFSTEDGGDSWEKIVNTSGDGFRYSSIYAMAIAPSDADTIYALKNGFGIFKSTNAGTSWNFTRESEVDYTYTIAVNPTDKDIVYSGYNPKPFQSWAWVRKTTDGGDTWTTALKVDNATSISSVVIDANDPETIYAAATGKGGAVMKSSDSGENWQNTNENFSFINVHTLEVDPNNSDTAYAGIWGGGVYVTKDGCQTWQKLESSPTPSAVSILIDPQKSSTLYLADRNSAKIYKSTDGGSNWTTYYDAGTGYYRILNAVLSPASSDVIYASIFKAKGSPMTGDIIKIESGTATILSEDLPRLPVFIAPHPTDTKTLYAVLHSKGVYKTTDGGQNWTDISGSTSGLPQSPQVGFNCLAISPNDSNVLYLTGGSDIDITLSSTGASQDEMNTVYKSTDSGATWTNLNDGNLGSEIGSIKRIAISSDDQTLFAAGLKGVFQSSDGGVTWQDISSGLPFTAAAGIFLSKDEKKLIVPTFGGGVASGNLTSTPVTVSWESKNNLFTDIYNVQLKIDPGDSNTIFASSYPGGLFKSSDSGITWSECNFALPSFEVKDPNRQGYYALGISQTNSNNLFLGLYGIGLYKSTDGAATWSFIADSAGMTVTSLLYDVNDSKTIYVATESGIYMSTDEGANWTTSTSGLDCTDIKILAQDKNGLLYAGSKGNGVYRFEKSSGSWQQLTAMTNFGILWPIWDRPLYQYTSLLFHPTDENIVTLGVFPSGIFQSKDGGTTWKEKNVGWANDGVFTLAYHPDDTDTIFAGTYNGINCSTDGGETWKSWSQGWADEQWVYSIDFDPENADIMYGCSKNGENKGQGREGFYGAVMKSDNGGETWQSINPAIVDSQEFYKIIVDPDNRATLYLATQKDGVLISKDSGSTWEKWNDGLTNTYSGTNGNNVTNTMILGSNNTMLFFGTAGSSVFSRALTAAITSQPGQTVNAGDLYTYNVIFVSDDEDTSVSYNLSAGPEGMKIDSETGSIQWQTSETDSTASYTVTVLAAQGETEATQTFTLQVQAKDEDEKEEEVNGSGSGGSCFISTL